MPAVCPSNSYLLPPALITLPSQCLLYSHCANNLTRGTLFGPASTSLVTMSLSLSSHLLPLFISDILLNRPLRRRRHDSRPPEPYPSHYSQRVADGRVEKVWPVETSVAARNRVGRQPVVVRCSGIQREGAHGKVAVDGDVGLGLLQVWGGRSAHPVVLAVHVVQDKTILVNCEILVLRPNPISRGARGVRYSAEWSEPNAQELAARGVNAVVPKKGVLVVIERPVVLGVYASSWQLAVRVTSIVARARQARVVAAVDEPRLVLNLDLRVEVGIGWVLPRRALVVEGVVDCAG